MSYLLTLLDQGEVWQDNDGVAHVITGMSRQHRENTAALLLRHALHIVLAYDTLHPVPDWRICGEMTFDILEREQANMLNSPEAWLKRQPLYRAGRVMSWVDGPWAGLDVETTGPNPETARIVQICIGYAARPGQWEPEVRLVNPGIPIPAEATAVHEITDATVAGEPTAEEIMPWVITQLAGLWGEGVPIVAFNAPFDLTVLDREKRRAFGSGLLVQGPVIDPLVLDKMTDRYRRGSRRLEDTCKLFGIETPQSHDAGADTFASVRLAWKIIKSRIVPAEPAGPDGEWTATTHLDQLELMDLHLLQAEAYEEQKLSFIDYRNRRGEPLDDLSTEWPMRTYKESS